MKWQAWSGCSGAFSLDKGRNESDSAYETRMDRSAQAAIIAELHAGTTTTDLYRTLAILDDLVRVMEQPSRCPFLTGSNSIPLPIQQGNNNAQEPNQSQAVESNSARGTSNSRDESPGIGWTDRRGTYLGAWPSFSISNIMRQPTGTTAQPFMD